MRLFYLLLLALIQFSCQPNNSAPTANTKQPDPFTIPDSMKEPNPFTGPDPTRVRLPDPFKDPEPQFCHFCATEIKIKKAGYDFHLMQRVKFDLQDVDTLNGIKLIQEDRWQTTNQKFKYTYLFFCSLKCAFDFRTHLKEFEKSGGKFY